MHYKIAQLSLSPGRNASTSGDVFVAQPDSIKEDLAGKLFIIIEIESSTTKDLKIINFLIDNLHHNYYNSEKILLRERISTLKIEHIFEAALAKTNKNFNAFLESNKYVLNPSSINLTAGVIHEDNLYLANRGKNKAFLIYKKKDEKKTKELILQGGVSEDELKRLYNRYGSFKKVSVVLSVESAFHSYQTDSEVNTILF